MRRPRGVGLTVLGTAAVMVVLMVGSWGVLKMLDGPGRAELWQTCPGRAR